MGEIGKKSGDNNKYDEASYAILGLDDRTNQIIDFMRDPKKILSNDGKEANKDIESFMEIVRRKSASTKKTTDVMLTKSVSGRILKRRRKKFRPRPINPFVNGAEGASQLGGDSGVSFSEIYPFVYNLYTDMFMKSREVIPSSKVDIAAPWDIMDGVIHTNSSSSPAKMPYQWNGNLKVIDASGNNVCLIHPSRRDMANIITASPDMFGMLCFMSFNREELFSAEVRTSEKFSDFFQKLEVMTSALINTYYSKLFTTDTEAILTATSVLFWQRLAHKFNNLHRKGRMHILIDWFLSENLNELETVIINTIRSSFSEAIKNADTQDFGSSEQVITISESLTNGLINNRLSVNEDNIAEILSEILKNNNFVKKIYSKVNKETEEYEENFTPYFTTKTFNSIDGFNYLFNHGANSGLDSKIKLIKAASRKEISEEESEENRSEFSPRNKSKKGVFANIDSPEKFDALFAILGVSPSVSKDIPLSLKYKFIEHVFQNNSVEKNLKPIGYNLIRIMWAYADMTMIDSPNVSINKQILEKIISSSFNVKKSAVKEAREAGSGARGADLDSSDSLGLDFGDSESEDGED